MREEKDRDPCMLVYLWDREKIIDSQVIIPLIDNEIFSWGALGQG